jgi:hypothetical protein
MAVMAVISYKDTSGNIALQFQQKSHLVLSTRHSQAEEVLPSLADRPMLAVRVRRR